jgi:hypothetical protein
VKITEARYDQAGMAIRFDGGDWGRLDWKKAMLDYGVAVFIPPVGSDLPNWMLHIPPFHHDGPHDVQRGTSDPVLVCMARRAFSRFQMPEKIGPGEEYPEVITEEEAIGEFASGRDALAREWPKPLAQAVPLEDTIRAARQGTLPEQKHVGALKRFGLIAFLTICALLFASAPPAAALDWHSSILDRLTRKSATSGTQTKAKVYFSPGGGCAEAVVEALAGAQKSVRIQAYSFTSAPIAKALVEAHRRGVNVQVILDKSNATGRYSSADFISRAGIPTFIDAAHAIAHNKVMVIDERQVITGSFNFTRAAEERNAENLLVIDDDQLAKQFAQNWEAHQQHSEPYVRRPKRRTDRSRLHYEYF